MNIFGIENKQKPFEETIEQLKANYANLEQDNKKKDEEIVRLKSFVESLKGELEKKEIPEQRIEECSTTESKIIDSLSVLDTIGADIKELRMLSDEIKKQLVRRDVQDENVKAMHKELEQYRGDFYSKITKPYLMAMLDLHKRFFIAYAHFDKLDDNKEDTERLYESLKGEFKSAVDALENSIYNSFGVELFEPVEFDEFNPKEHQSIEVINTDNQELHRKIAKVLYGGFRELDSGKILRTARVSCYKYSYSQQ